MRWQSEVTRRTLLSHTAAGTAALATGAMGAYAQQASKPPNIVFILADDLGYADVSCYGRRDFDTPNIDRIAARGVRFLQGYANSSVCSATCARRGELLREVRPAVSDQPPAQCAALGLGSARG